MPIIQVRLKLNLMHKGDQLVILADDHTFHDEFARFCQLADITLLKKTYHGDFYEYLVQTIS
jgi:TusA-related sulfurtransferase